MLKMGGKVLWAWVVWVLIACTAPLVKVGQTTQEEVRQYFGKPHSVRSFIGSEEWRYQFSTDPNEDPAARLPTGGPAGPGRFPGQVVSHCQEYIFLFDDQGVLTNWEKRRC